VFTLNSVPLASEEAVAGGVARNFISRDLLEAHNLDDALERARERHLSVGHNYNIMDINERKIVTVETASNARSSSRNIAMEPFFHANMYLHLQVPQVTNGLWDCKRQPFFPVPFLDTTPCGVAAHHGHYCIVMICLITD
jgi:hypothetical protein